MENKISVLVVDDEASIQLTLRKLIEMTFPDTKVTVASNGREAWDIICDQPPSIILSDISMPEMDGIQLLIKVRSKDDFNDIFFIVVTGNSDSAQRVMALEKGADEFITKPIISDQLQARLRSAMRMVKLQMQRKEENQLLVDLAAELERDIQDMAKLAVKFMQARIPASYEMLQKIASASVWIAGQIGKFSKEEIRDIEIAAYLSQAGRMSLPDELLKTPVLIDGKPSHSLMYQVPVAAREIVSSVRRFDHVGKILYHIYENLDGSGFPGRLQAWQIPLASRIIRVALDYHDMIQQTKKSPREVIQYIHDNAKSIYDNRVAILMEHFIKSTVQEEMNSNETALLLSDLIDGMVLTRDIITDKGLKLLPAGAILRENIINKIISHNTSDPILGNVYVKIQ